MRLKPASLNLKWSILAQVMDYKTERQARSRQVHDMTTCTWTLSNERDSNVFSSIMVLENIMVSIISMGRYENFYLLFFLALIHYHNHSILFMLMTTLLSADNLCKQFNPHQDPQNVGPDLDANCMTLWDRLWKDFLKKFNFEKSQKTTKAWKITQHAKS